MQSCSKFDLTEVLWVDSEIEEITINYDNFVITITESANSKTKIVFKGYIGYCVVGFWDEAIIESFSVHTNHEFLERCVFDLEKKYGHKLPDTGNANRNNRNFKLGEIRLIDGTSILVAAESAEIIR